MEHPLPLVVPFHNERRRLPRLIASLRAQCPSAITVVFVDNGSSDGSAALVHECEEVRNERWIALAEPTIGKFHAVSAATRFCIETLGARHIAFLDADSEFEDATWFARTLDLVAHNAAMLGYVHSAIFYADLQVVPRLFRAYLAYDAVVRGIVRAVGWLASGNAFACSADVLREYFRRAGATTEFDLRCSLLALAEGLEPFLNDACVVTSARRSLASQANLDAWCFYRREFYSAKDINAAVKQDLDRRGEIADLPPGKLDEFFARRACKITSRHLVPFLIFGGRRDNVARTEETLDIRIDAGELASLDRFRLRKQTLFGDEFEDMIRSIEAHPVAQRIARRMAECMRKRYDSLCSVESGVIRFGAAPTSSVGSAADDPMRVPES
jgi:glycosyltransferase involved in cell wall biosynthesis